MALSLTAQKSRKQGFYIIKVLAPAHWCDYSKAVSLVSENRATSSISVGKTVTPQGSPAASGGQRVEPYPGGLRGQSFDPEDDPQALKMKGPQSLPSGNGTLCPMPAPTVFWKQIAYL